MTGLLKRCDCPKRRWGACGHPWHLHTAFRKTRYRLSLDALSDKPLTSRAEAVAFAADLLAKIRRGAWPPKDAAPVPAPTPAALTFAELAGLWLQRARAPLVAAGALSGTANDRAVVRRWCAASVGPDGATLGQRPLGRLTVDDLETAYASIAAGRSGRTVNGYRTVLLQIQDWAQSKHYIGAPWLASKALKRRKASTRTRRVPRDLEAKLLAVAPVWLGHLIIAAIESGCRRGELLGLCWGAVSLDDGTITLAASETKTRAARIIPLTPRLADMLTALRGPDPRKAPPPGSRVFGVQTGDCGAVPVNPKRAWETTILKAHGVPVAWTPTHGLAPVCRAKLRDIGLHFHDLRREAGSRLLEAGVPLHHVRLLLGHANISMTSTYLSASVEDVKASMTRAAERIAEAEKAKAEKARQDADRAKAAQDARDICHTAATGASADHLAYVAVNR